MYGLFMLTVPTIFLSTGGHMCDPHWPHCLVTGHNAGHNGLIPLQYTSYDYDLSQQLNLIILRPAATLAKGVNSNILISVNVVKT
jgi:hypothetical protein